MWWKHAVNYILILTITVWAIRLHIMMKNYNKDYSKKIFSISNIWFNYVNAFIVLAICDIYIWIK